MKASALWLVSLTLLLQTGGCEFRASLLGSPEDASLSDALTDDASPCGRTDSDGDGVPTEIEGTLDIDADGLGNDQDTDSDGDGIDDSTEIGESPCYPQDSDLDGVPDFIDFDSDNDGLRDEHEIDFGTSPTEADSDSDGQDDGIEFALGTRGNDASSITRDAEVARIPSRGGTEVRLTVGHERVDLVIMTENTNAARASIGSLGDSLSEDLLERLDALSADTRIGVATFSDYPDAPFGTQWDRPGSQALPTVPVREDLRRPPTGFTYPGCVDFSGLSDSDKRLYGMHPVLDGPSSIPAGSGNGVPDLVDALRAQPCFGGGDAASSQLFALRSIISINTFESWQLVSPSMGQAVTFPRDLCANYPLARGMSCVHSEASALVVLVGLGDFHGIEVGPPSEGSVYPFSGSLFGESLNIKSSGFSVAAVRLTPPPADSDGYEGIARASETVDASGEPLVRYSPSPVDTASLLVELAEAWANDTPIPLSVTRIAESSLSIEGARDAAPLIDELVLVSQELGAYAPTTRFPVTVQVTAAPGPTEQGQFPLAYTADLVALRATSVYPIDPDAVACEGVTECAANETCTGGRCSPTAIVARSRIAWVLPAQADGP